MNTVQPMYEWNTIPWHKLERIVFKLQRRIYRASLSGKGQQVRKLQKLLTNSWSAKLLAVRRVSQDNSGKKTAGVDGVKSITPKQRLKLASTLDLNHKVKPIRRVWIPKPGKKEKRPLGIPVMRDRATQALVKMAIEPEWEAKFEGNSFGFRPGRNCHDAIQAIHDMLRHHGKYVLDADIAGCFDNINHDVLLEKMNTYPKLKRLISNWLKAGIMDGDTYTKPKAGTPQGGVASPLLANIALHGMEEVIKSISPKAYFVRYADDFIVLHNDLEIIEQCKQALELWLNNIGLELKPSKTKITHTLNEHEGNLGFDFLGFNIRQYQMGKYRSGKRGKGFKTLIKPSKDSIKRHLDKISKIIGKGKALPTYAIINQLNPVIRGWTNYFSTEVSSEAFKRLTHKTVIMLMRWSRRRHPKKSFKWIKNKYFTTHNGYQWTLHDDELVLLRHSQTPIKRWVRVANTRSPYDGDWVYWSKRMAKHPQISREKSYLINQQKGKCSYCKMHFSTNDLLEVHHIDGDHRNNRWDNRTLMHRHCHDKVHKTDA